MAALAAADITGDAPQAVARAVRSALRHAPTGDEREWIDRIELLRALMRKSPQELEIVDFGAGAGSEFDTGEKETRHVSRRTLGQMTLASKPPEGGYLLMQLIRQVRPEAALELGACVGVSASYMAAAMELNGSGRLITLEGADALASRTARTLEELLLDGRAEVRRGRFADTLEKAAGDIAPIGLAFIDGHHIESATIDYMNTIAPFTADEAVLVFDDINWSPGMRKAWATIASDDRFALTVDLGAVGLAVRSASATTRARITV